MDDIQLGRFWRLSEFRRGSQRELTAAEVQTAAYLVREALDPARSWYGGPIVIPPGGFVRLDGGGPHPMGEAVDIQPVYGSRRAIYALADWLAWHLHPGEPGSAVAQVLVEDAAPGQHRPHVHISRELAPGASPGYLWGDGRGAYAYRDVPSNPPSPPPLGGALPVILAALAVVLGIAFLL